jgi:hypothetical protein
MTQRIFHPIGQGAFYCEKHNGSNIVYDCGYWRKSKKASQKVSQSFLKTETIKILFISHFDFDHVSLIPTLRNSVSNIDYVVMPLLHNDEKFFLINFYRVLGFDFLELIQNPSSFFGENTKVIFVKPSDEKIDFVNQDNLNLENLENLTEIKSGSKITFSKEIPKWVFIPYNFDYNRRNADLEIKLRNAGFNVQKLKTDAKYTLAEIVKDVNLTVKKGGKIFQKIYDSLSGKINENSMILYSGPSENNTTIFSKRMFIPIKPYRYRRHFNNNVGCVYTGDSDFNVIDINVIYNRYWKFVGTVQIPHHGDIKCFKTSFLNKDLFCPISYGTNNSYGHPSSTVVTEILKHNSIPIFVNENPTNLFLEIF